MAGDDDVLDAVVVDQRLEAAEPEERVEDRLRQSPAAAAGLHAPWPASTPSAIADSIRSSTIDRPSSCCAALSSRPDPTATAWLSCSEPERAARRPAPSRRRAWPPAATRDRSVEVGGVPASTPLVGWLNSGRRDRSPYSFRNREASVIARASSTRANRPRATCAWIDCDRGLESTDVGAGLEVPRAACAPRW